MKVKSLSFFTFASLAAALTLDVDDPASIREAAAVVAKSTRYLYTGDQPGGVLGKWPFPPYYWWESGAAWGSMIQYYINTGDDVYNDLIHQSLMAQLGPNYDFINAREIRNTGNDDQAFWAFNAMTMAEYGLRQPDEPAPSWLTVAETVWTQFTQRWNTTYCAGGLKWHFRPENNGFHYKQTISNGAFFQMSARLARYTGESKYLDWAEKIWKWTTDIGLIDQDYNVYDGSDELINCTGIDHHQWSYNIGVYLYGSAVLSNITESSTWQDRTNGLLDSAGRFFFSPYENATDIMFEPNCEPFDKCNTDQRSMKAYLSRWMVGTALMAPYTADRIGQYFRASAPGAAAACSGGRLGTSCGTKWYINASDGTTGLGQQISALEMIGGLLFDQIKAPGTADGV